MLTFGGPLTMKTKHSQKNNNKYEFQGWFPLFLGFSSGMPTWGFTKKALLSLSPERNLALFSSSLSPGAMLQRRKYSFHFPTKLDPSGNALSSNAEVREHVYCCCRWRFNPKVNVQQQKIPLSRRGLAPKWPWPFPGSDLLHYQSVPLVNLLGVYKMPPFSIWITTPLLFHLIGPITLCSPLAAIFFHML